MKHWSEDQWGDFPLRRRTDRNPDRGLQLLASLLVMTFAVFGVIALASGWIPHR